MTKITKGTATNINNVIRQSIANIITSAPTNCKSDVIAFGNVEVSKFFTCDVSLTNRELISPVLTSSKYFTGILSSFCHNCFRNLETTFSPKIPNNNPDNALVINPAIKITTVKIANVGLILLKLLINFCAS